MEDKEEGANGFNDWESLHSIHYYNPSPSSSSSSSSSPNLPPPGITPHHHDLAIFPPVNHEGLPIPPPPPPYAPLSLSNSNSDSDSRLSSPPPLRNSSHFAKWFDFALHLWNSKLLSAITHIRNRGFFSSLRPIKATASFLVVLWFWVCWLRRWRRRRQRRCGGEESVEQLKRVIKEKDEKIIQLLEQIAQMNRVLLSRYKIPVLRST